jgi:hypothetical protein
MDDDYDTCSYCGWAGKLRKDGTVRKHREARDSGRIGSTGSLPQDPNGPICKGSGTEPWKVGLPDDYEVPQMNEHGGFVRDATTASEPVWQAAQFDAFAVGDRIRFQTIDNGYGGSGDFVSRTGTVTAVTASTLRVECDWNWFGNRAVLRRSDWYRRDPHKAV